MRVQGDGRDLFARTLERLGAGAALGSRLDTIANAVGAATLDNYQGKLCVEILDAQGHKIPLDPGRAPDAPSSPPLWPEYYGTRPFPIRSNQVHTLQAWFETDDKAAQASEMCSSPVATTSRRCRSS